MADYLGLSAPSDFSVIFLRSIGHVGACAQGTLVGFVNVAWDGGEHASIFDVGVHPDHRRRGVATAMVHEATRLARERGALWLHVDFHLNLSGFYRRCGFHPTEAGLMRLR